MTILSSSTPLESIPPESQKNFITINDFQKIEIRAGKILSVEKIPNTDKLLKLSVDFAESQPRQIVSGIALHFPDPNVLVGRICAFVANLEPRMIKGYESQGMILAVSHDSAFSLLSINEDIPAGTKIK